MRFLHLSDLHIGVKLYEYDLLEEQKEILDQIVALAEREKPDAIVMAGDIYDRSVPAVEAVALFDAFMHTLRQALPEAALMVVSGNHDSPQRLDVFRQELMQQGVYMIGNPPQREGEQIASVSLTDAYGTVNFHLLPFVKPSMVRVLVGTKENGDNLSYEEAYRRLLALHPIDTTQRNVLVSHQFFLPAGAEADDVERAETESRMVGNVDAISATLIADFDYAALGHIHKPMKVGSGVLRYCGTPMAYSLSEEGQQKGVILVEMREKGDVRTEVLPLMPRRAVRRIRGDKDTVLSMQSDDYVAVTLTNLEAVEMNGIREMLRDRFPHLLEIRREGAESVDYSAVSEKIEELSPYELCLAFAGDRLCDEEKEMLEEAVRQMQEGEAT